MEREGRKGGEEGGSAGGGREKVKEREWGGRSQAQNVSKIKLRELFSAHVTSDLCKELLLLLPSPSWPAGRGRLPVSRTVIWSFSLSA